MKTYLIQNQSKAVVNAYGLEIAAGQTLKVDLKTYMSACRMACIRKVGQLDDNDTEILSDNKHVCEKCGKEYKSESALKKHVEKCGDQ